MRKFTTVGFMMLAIMAVAQQLPQYSQYQFNDYVFNPAVAGSRNYFEARSGHRSQWVGITDAPRTYTISATTPIADQRMGIGGYIYTDNVGPTRRTGIQGSFAYHLKLTETLKLSLALSVGIQQFLVDGSKITLRDPGDNVIGDEVQSSLVPDGKFGLYLYHERYYFGLTVPQLMQNELKFFDEQTSTMSNLETHIYAMGGYRLPLGEDWMLEPQFMLKYVDPVPMDIDLTAMLHYKKVIWVGASYRTSDAIVAMLGGTLSDAFSFGYSSDIATSNLKNYSNGTHEIMLGIQFGRKAPEQITEGSE